MSPLYFVSRNTGHRFAARLSKNELGFFYDSDLDRMSPIIYTTIEGENIIPAVISGNQDEKGHWHTVIAMGEIKIGAGSIVINQLSLKGKEKNPPIVRLINDIK